MLSPGLVILRFPIEVHDQKYAEAAEKYIHTGNVPQINVLGEQYCTW